MFLYYKIKNKFFNKQKNLCLGILDQSVSFWKPFLFLLPSLLAILLFTLIPFILTIKDALTVTAGFGSNEKIGFENFYILVQLTSFKVGLRNSLIYSILSVPISLILSLLISSTIVHLIKRFVRESWLTIFFMPYVTSAVAVSTAFFYMFSTNNGLINTIIGTNVPWLTDSSTGSWYSFITILINGVWSNLAFQILILTTAMLGVNKDLYKSASIDGASKTKQFFKITLPSINRTLNFLITIGIIGSIKVFPLPLFNNDPGQAIANNGATLLLLVYYYISPAAGSVNFQNAAATSIILFLIGILTSIILTTAVKLVIKSSLYIGDLRVKNKIKNYQLLA